MVYDINRPDVDGNKPKMIGLVPLFANPHEDSIPYWSVECSDNLGSHIFVRGSLDPKEKWQSSIFHNSRNFIFSIAPPNGKYFYKDGEKLQIELLCCQCRKNGESVVKKFRKYTGTPEECAKKMADWLKLCIDNQPTTAE